jgi:hypothetical protein
MIGLHRMMVIEMPSLSITAITSVCKRYPEVEADFHLKN